MGRLTRSQQRVLAGSIGALCFLSVVVLLMPFSPLSSHAKEGPAAVDLTVAYIGGSRHSVALGLRNNSSHVVSLMESRLPWRHRWSISMTLVKADDSRSILAPGASPFDDPSPSIVDIRPGETVQGIIELCDVFPTLTADLEVSRIDVFYAYDVSVIGNTDRRRLGGWFIVPRMRASLSAITEK